MVLIRFLWVDVRELMAVVDSFVRKDGGTYNREDQLDAHGQENVEI